MAGFTLSPVAMERQPAAMAMTLTLGFDADDTLWHNESIFEETHRRYCELLARYHDAATVEQKLFATEMRNLELFGYGVKAHALSSIETAIEMTNGRIGGDEVRAIIDLAKKMLRHPVELLDGAAEIIPALARDYQLMLITKGDLRDQERKLRESGLEPCFTAVEIVSEKNTSVYERVLARHGVAPKQLVMIGNSLKSDILPVLELGGYGVHIPYRITWQHEQASAPSGPKFAGRFFQIDNLRGLPPLLQQLRH